MAGNERTNEWTNERTNEPANEWTNQPTIQPTNQPANQPTNQPTNQSTNQPTNQSINHPTNQSPTNQHTVHTYIQTNRHNIKLKIFEKFVVWFRRQSKNYLPNTRSSLGRSWNRSRSCPNHIRTFDIAELPGTPPNNRCPSVETHWPQLNRMSRCYTEPFRILFLCW